VVSLVALQESCIGFVAAGAFWEGVAEGLGVAGEAQTHLALATWTMLPLEVQQSSPP